MLISENWEEECSGLKALIVYFLYPTKKHNNTQHPCKRQTSFCIYFAVETKLLRFVLFQLVAAGPRNDRWSVTLWTIFNFSKAMIRRPIWTGLGAKQRMFFAISYSNSNCEFSLEVRKQTLYLLAEMSILVNSLQELPWVRKKKGYIYITLY